MAEKEHILLESIFDTACVIEESMLDTVKSGMQFMRNKASEVGKKIGPKVSEVGDRLGKKVIDVGTNLAAVPLMKAIQLGNTLSNKSNKKLNEIKRDEIINNAKKTILTKASKIGDYLKIGGGLGLGILGLSKKEREKARENTDKSANTGSGVGTVAALLGAGAGAGVAAKALYDKVPEIADETREHIHSLHDKLANMINAHHEE
jgi:hypothetical protein